MDIPHKIDDPIEGKSPQKENLSKKVPYLFLRNYKKVIYSLNGKPDRTFKSIS